MRLIAVCSAICAYGRAIVPMTLDMAPHRHSMPYNKCHVSLRSTRHTLLRLSTLTLREGLSCKLLRGFTTHRNDQQVHQMHKLASFGHTAALAAHVN